MMVVVGLARGGLAWARRHYLCRRNHHQSGSAAPRNSKIYETARSMDCSLTHPTVPT